MLVRASERPRYNIPVYVRCPGRGRVCVHGFDFFLRKEESGYNACARAFPMINRYEAGDEPYLAIASLILSPSSLRRFRVSESG